MVFIITTSIISTKGDYRLITHHGSRNLDKFELTLLLRIFNHIKYIVVTYLSLITYGILSYFTINGIL